MSALSGRVKVAFVSPSTLTTPALAEIHVLDNTGEEHVFFAKGKIATKVIMLNIQPGQAITVTHSDKSIESVEVFG